MDDPGRGRAQGGDQWLAPDDPIVADAPGYVGDTSAPTARPRSLPWILTTGGVAIVLVLVVLVIANRPGAEPDPGTDDQAGPTVEDLGVAAPWDGKASLRLPVTITPNRDLVDGQEVAVTASGFPPDEDLGVVMCTNQAVFAGIMACDINTALSSLKGFPVRSDAQGNVSTRYRVSTHISVSVPSPGNARPPIVVDGVGSTTGGTVGSRAQQLDCTTGDIDPDVWLTIIPPNPSADPGGFTCIIAVGVISDYDKSGGAAVGFAGSTFRSFETTTTAPDPTVEAETTVPADPAAPTAPTDPTPPQSAVTSTYPTYPPLDPSTTTTGPPPDQPPPPLDPDITTTAPSTAP